MNPNQPHHTGQFQAPVPQNQWPQTPTPAKKTGMPIAGAYGLGLVGIILGVIAVVIALTSGTSESPSNASSVDQATADKRVCAASQSANNITAAAGYSWLQAQSSKAQQSDALAAYGSAISTVLAASTGSSAEVQAAVTNWVETVQKQMAATITGAELDSAAAKLKAASCK